VTENVAGLGVPLNGPGSEISDVIRLRSLLTAREPLALVIMSQKLLTTIALKLTSPVLPIVAAVTGLGAGKFQPRAEKKLSIRAAFLLVFNRIFIDL
jgi:hypothetical protein